VTLHFLVLRRRTGLSTGVATLIDTLHRVRRRGLDRFRRLDPTAWPAPTRLPGRSVHDIAEHLVRMAESRTTLSGTPDGKFPGAPGPSPYATWTPARTVWSMGHAIEDEYRALLTLAIPAGDRPDADGWHWSLRVAHLLWDAWHHERDVCHALGVRTRATADETRLVALYSLLYAAETAAEVEGRASFRFSLTGSLRGVYGASASAGDALATFGLLERPPIVEVGAGAVLDALAGRGPEMATILAGFPDLARQLEYARRLTMTGATAAAPPDQASSARRCPSA
jgi:hypothetical protein